MCPRAARGSARQSLAGSHVLFRNPPAPLRCDPSGTPLHRSIHSLAGCSTGNARSRALWRYPARARDRHGEIGNDALGRQCHGKRKKFEQDLDRAGLRDKKRRLYRALAAEGIGREIVMFARMVEQQ